MLFSTWVPGANGGRAYSQYGKGEFVMFRTLTRILIVCCFVFAAISLFSVTTRDVAAQDAFRPNFPMRQAPGQPPLGNFNPFGMMMGMGGNQMGNMQGMGGMNMQGMGGMNMQGMGGMNMQGMGGMMGMGGGA